MNTLQAEIAALQKQIDQLIKRRQELIAERDKGSQGLISQRKSLSSLLLGGGKADSGLDAVAREQARLSVLEEALEEADKQIQGLEQQKIDKQRGLQMADFYLLEGEAQELVLSGIDKLYEYRSLLDAITEKFTALQRAGSQAGMGEIRAVDSVNLLMTVAGNLHNSLGGPNHDAANISLVAFETAYAAFIAELRAKRKR